MCTVHFTPSPLPDKHPSFTCCSLPPLQQFKYHTWLPGVLSRPLPSVGYQSCPERCLLPETLGRSGFVLSSLHSGCALCVRRVGRSRSDGLHLKPSSTGSSPPPVMCGATGSSCGKSCPTERGLTGTWPIKMYVPYLPVLIFKPAADSKVQFNINFFKQCFTTCRRLLLQSFI